MSTLSPTLITDAAAWNDLLRALPAAHVLQSWEWGAFKQHETGWSPERFAYRDDSGGVVAAASVLTRRAGPFRVMYVPKGPALDYARPDTVGAVLDHLGGLARQRHAVWLKIDPDAVAGTGIPTEPPHQPDPAHPPQSDPTGQAVIAALKARGWRFSASQVQFRHTLTLDLAPGEDDLLSAMNQSTRRKLRTATKQGVQVRLAAGDDDLRTLYGLYTITGARQGFLIRPLDYYREAWSRFMQSGLATAFLAEAEGQALAGLVLFHFGRRAWYFYGMSSDDERQRMPTYLVQWEAIRWAKAQGYAVYDFWGAPDVFNEDAPMWGVYRFKAGFGAQVVRTIGAWDTVPHPVLYWAYERLIPRVLGLMKKLAAFR